MDAIKEYHLAHADIRVEEDLVWVRVHGSMKEEQIPQTTALMRQIQEQRGKVFLLVDVREGESIPPTMRRQLAQVLGDSAPAAMGVYGANLEQHARHALLMGAVAGVSGRRPNVAYFHSETEAREWLAGERQRLSSS